MKTNLPEIQVNRDSIAFNADFKQTPSNQGRYERICIASRPVVTMFPEAPVYGAWDVDGDFVLCSDVGYAYITIDGVNFTLIADTIYSEPFVSYRSPFDFIRSIKVMDDGSWILCLGQTEEGAKGNLFRSTDKGSTWTWVMEFESGYVTSFGWCAISDSEVAIGEYGYKPQCNSPRRVYYSDDYGATWSKIYEPEPAGQHLHLCAFKPGDTNNLYVSYGDSAPAEVIKLQYTPGPGGKKDLNNWSETSNSPIYISNPTCAFSDGRYLYWGHDGAWKEPVIWRLDPIDDSLSRALDWPNYVDNPDNPYRKDSPKGDVYSMCIHDGIYYAAIRGINHKVGGIYVSVDGEHWICAYRVEGASAFQYIVGYASGYLWGTYHNGHRPLVYKMEPVNVDLVEALRIEGGITNIFDNPNDSSFETSNHNWSLWGDVNTVSSGITTEDSLHGESSLKIVCADKGYGYTTIHSDLWENLGGNPQVGDYICVSFWIKLGPNWPFRYSFCADIISAGEIYYARSCGDDIMDEWQKITIWGKCVSDVASHIQLRIIFDDYGYGGDFSDATCYIDCIQVVYSPDLHNSGSWQLGGVARDNEYAWQSLVGIGRDFTSTFEWRPELSSREWHNDIPIASWTDDTNHIDLYYDKSVSKFVATDGVHTVMTNNTYAWEHLDCIKLGFGNRDCGFMLSVETPLNGSEHVVTGCSLLGEPNSVVFGTNHSNTGTACGLIATVRHWSRALVRCEIEQVWDIYAPVGDFAGDWYIDFQDFAVLAAQWLRRGTSCADIGPDGGDGVVNMLDLAVLAENWLAGVGADEAAYPVHNVTQDLYYLGIQPALDDANDDDYIKVYPNTYYETINFNDVNCKLVSANPNDPDIVTATIIDAKGSGSVVTFDSSEDANSILNGLTITGGGPGIYCSGASPTVKNCVITENDAEEGGGMYNDGGSPTLNNCIFSSNSAETAGGGMYTAEGSPTLTNCIFSENTITESECDGGGGMFIDGGSATLTNCVFTKNEADKCEGCGGGIWNSGDTTLTNCTFNKNIADDSGGGMYNVGGCEPTITNCIFWDNEDEISNPDADPTVTYCDVEGGYTGTGNIDADPNFVNANDPDGTDNIWFTSDDGLMLTTTRAIDSANGNVEPATDILSQGRFDDPNWTNVGIGDPNYVDMGAYEHDPNS